MANLITIECQDCGSPRNTRYKNTKYCEVCRLLRNVAFVGSRTTKCLVSGKRFAPIARNQELSLTCDPYSTKAQVEGDCALCGNHTERLYGPNVGVCVECIDDPEKRNQIKAALIRKQAELKSGEAQIHIREIDE